MKPLPEVKMTVKLTETKTVAQLLEEAQRTISLLVSAGLVSDEKVAQARALASK